MMIKNSKVYDILKFVAQILLPAVGTLYTALAILWGFGGVAEVGGTILAVDTFLGTVLQLASSAYNASDEKYDGFIDPSKMPKALGNKKDLHLKVKELEDSPRKRASRG